MKKRTKFKFRRYKVEYKKRTYYIFIPFEFDQLWIMDWADDWYAGAFIEGGIRCLKYLIAGFCILAFNPYAIIYLPVRKNKRPHLYYGDDGDFDIVFRTTKVWISDKNLRNIVRNLKYYKWTTYKAEINLDRMKRYFAKNLRRIKNIPNNKILINADGHISNNIVYYSFPQIYYQEQAIDFVEYFIEDVFKNDSYSECYDSKYDYFNKPFMSFVYDGKRKRKFNYRYPSLTFYIEFFDIDVMNRYQKEKIHLVDYRKTRR